MRDRNLQRGTTELYLPVRHRLVPLQSVAINAVLLIVGIALVLQPTRWSRTPAYGNLLQLAPPYIWGVLYLTAGAVLFVAVFVVRAYQALSIVAHTLVIALLCIWETAFIIRYLTDSSTTIVNVVSWGVYLFLCIRSAVLFDHPVLAAQRGVE